MTTAKESKRAPFNAPPTHPDRWGGLDPGPTPAGWIEPKDPILLEYVSGGRIAIITFNRPGVNNSVTTAMAACFAEVLEEIETKVTVRCAILTGAGKAFCGGADLRERKDMNSQQWLKQRRDFDRTLYTLRQMRRPIFAAVNGLANGGGCEIAQSCDFRIASENASFAQAEAMVGISAGGGSTQMLPLQLSPGMAMDMLMTGDAISAQEAYRLGFVNQVCAPEELMNVALDIAERIARNSPTAVQAAKLATREGQGVPLEHGITINLEAHWRSAVFSDRIEGVTAWNEGREPKFKDPER